MAETDSLITPSPTPLVSVAITAYNSEKWLGRAIRSVLEQQTNFPIEIVIGDDCSQDRTVEVVQSYQERYPNIVQIFTHAQNVGIQRNYYETFEQCRGKYIAWLDADDYWTDPEKLAIQVQTLEADSTINVCGHVVRWVSPEGEVQRDRYPSIPAGRYGMDEILRHDFLPSPSILFRREIYRSLPEWYFDLKPITDWPIWVLAALTGDIVLLDRVMADYMLTPGSSMMSQGQLYWYKTDARFYEHIESILPAKWHRLVRSEKGKRYEALAYALRKQGEFTPSREAAVRAFRSPATMDNLASKTKTLVAAIVREMEWKIRGGKT